jgi:hypothetical protein
MSHDHHAPAGVYPGLRKRSRLVAIYRYSIITVDPRAPQVEGAFWRPWAVPCPIRSGDIQNKKQKSRTKARMDARTRERLPVMPALTAATHRERKGAAVRLYATRTALSGAPFTAGGQTLRRIRLTRSSHRIWGRGMPRRTGRPGTRTRPRRTTPPPRRIPSPPHRPPGRRPPRSARSDARDALMPQWLPMGRITADTEVDP